MHGRRRIAWPGLPTLRTGVSQDASRLRCLNARIFNNRTETTEDETEKEEVGGHGVAAFLVAALGVLFCVLGHADHLGDTNGVESSECLWMDCQYAWTQWRVTSILADKRMQCLRSK